MTFPPAPASAGIPRLDDAFARIDAAAEAMVARTIAWSRINSGSLEIAGLQVMAGALADAFSGLPGPLERVALAPSERVRADGVVEARAHGDAIRVRVRPEAPVQVALTGHYDTVFAASHPFQTPRPPAGDVLNGPGVADMKGGLMVMLTALEALERTPDASGVGYEILLSPDEEIGSPASAPLLAALGARAHVGMTYEPALPDGALAGARKGSGNYSLIITGKAAHVGRAFEDGRSAVVAAADAVLRLNDLNGRRDGVTVNVGAIDGGAPVNMVPAGAVVRFNVRIPDDESRRWIEGEVAKVAACACARDGIAARLHGGVTRAPKPMTESQARLFGWVRAAGEGLGLSLTWSPTGGVCEGNNLFAAGCPNVDTLGVRGGHLHSDQEYALLSSFAERAKLSLSLLCGFASGAFDARSLRT
ncbi:MAG: hydrolase [Hyphomonadaceae bacterium]|nr:hydrolase [Hyphomonadaceae bacterium]